MQLWHVQALTLAPGEDVAVLRKRAAEALRVDTGAVRHFEVLRRSLDARKKGHPLFRHTVIIGLDERARVKAAPLARPYHDSAPPPPVPRCKRNARVVVIGAGPGGLFAALRLKDAGLKPIIIDRGKAVEPRAQDVQRFKRQRELDLESNFCFGEGGAGTWSDGKLTTRIGDPRTEHVLREIVRLGGPPEILIEGKPHLGTNRLVKWLRSLRAELIAHGVEFRFGTRAEHFVRAGTALRGVKTQGGDVIDCEMVVLATGHSAREVYTWMQRENIALEQKAFSVGYRIEHPQLLINELQYGHGVPNEILPAADYRLTENLELDGHKRGIYSFCMCPGGVIVPTATEFGGICINGMSHASRSSPWANSAIVVSVEPHDFGWGGQDGVLAGIAFQRKAERAAYVRGGSTFQAPVQRASDYLAGTASKSISASSFRPGVVPGSLAGIYPDFVDTAIRQALQRWNKRMRGYTSSEASLLAVETRTSSPVRILRNEQLESPSLPGLYPMGEGAGYAGGIMSAAVDGVRVADAIIAKLV